MTDGNVMEMSPGAGQRDIYFITPAVFLPFPLLFHLRFPLPFLNLFLFWFRLLLFLQSPMKRPQKRGPPVLLGRQEKRENMSGPLLVGVGGGRGQEEKKNKESNDKGVEPVVRSGPYK